MSCEVAQWRLPPFLNHEAAVTPWPPAWGLELAFPRVSLKSALGWNTRAGVWAVVYIGTYKTSLLPVEPGVGPTKETAFCHIL